MANNTTLNVGTGGDVISTEDVSGVKIPRTKLVLGASGVDGGNISVANPVPAQEIAGSSGGATPFHLLSAASTNATSVKTSAGNLYSIQLVNRSTTANAYVKFFDKASTPSVGTDTPVKTLCLPAAYSTTQPTVLVHGFPMPVSFTAGIAVAITGGTGLNADTTAVAANDVTLDLDYK